MEIMTSQYQTGPNSQDTAAQFSEQSMLMSSEAAYDRLTGYAFARRFVGGKSVADISWEDVGYGPRLLAETARSVVGLTNSPEVIERALTTYPLSVWAALLPRHATAHRVPSRRSPATTRETVKHRL